MAVHNARHGEGAYKSAILRQDDRCIWAKADATGTRHRVCPRFGSLHVETRKIGKGGAVTVPVAVEAHPPQSGSGQPDTVGIIAAIRKIGDHHDVVAGASVVPAVKGYDLVGIIDVEYVDILSTQPARIILPVAPKMDKIAIEIDDTRKARCVRPVELLAIGPCAPGQKLLAHEDHRNSRRRKHKCSRKR